MLHHVTRTMEAAEIQYLASRVIVMMVGNWMIMEAHAAVSVGF